MSDFVSVIMPIYNAQRYVREAIESIQAQTHADWELLCLDDGSRDQSAGIVQSLADDDERIRYIRFENRGIVPTMNDGIRMSSGRWIARMDADDVSLPERFEIQLAFLKLRPEIAVVGSGCQIIDRDGNVQKEKRYCPDPDRIREELATRNCLCHPSVMMRRDVLQEFEGPYRAEFLFAEDYDLWLRMSETHPLANLDEPLLQYRVDASRIHAERIITETLSCLATRYESRSGRRVIDSEGSDHSAIDRTALIEAGLSSHQVDFSLRRALVSAARRAHRGGFRTVSRELIRHAGEFLCSETSVNERLSFYLRTLQLKCT